MPDNRILQDQLIEALYELALYPDNFDSFAEMWEHYLIENVPSSGADISERLSRHFGRAFQILEKFGRDDTITDQTLETSLDTRDLPSIAINLDGEILALNDDAKHLFNTKNTTPTIEDLANKKSLELLSKGISNARQGQPFPMVVLLANSQPALLLLQRLPSSETVLIDITGSRWDVRMHATLMSMYALTQTECTVASLLYQGLTVADIAARENRAVDTIRQHTNSLLRKTQTHSQPRLMKLLTSFNFAQSSNEQVRWANSKCENHILTLNDGRLYGYYDSGSNSQKTIVSLHGLLHDPELPDLMHKSLEEDGYRIIGPSRAWFGDSSPPSNTDNILVDSAHDLIELLDHLQIESAILLGHMAGSAHAYTTAALYPDRVEKIINISGVVPLQNERQFKSMPMGVRAVIRTAKYFPSLLPTLIRTALSLIDRGDIRKLFNTIYRTSQIDIDATKQDCVFQRLSIGYRFAAHHGHSAYTYEGLAVAQDFSHVLEKVTCVTHLIHGEYDGLISINSVSDFSDNQENMHVSMIKGVGQLMMYTKPKQVTRTLMLTLRRDT